MAEANMNIEVRVTLKEDQFLKIVKLREACGLLRRALLDFEQSVDELADFWGPEEDNGHENG